MTKLEVAFPKLGYIFPNMGKLIQNDEASALFGKVRKSLLSILLLHPETSYFFREIRDLVNAGSGAVHRELGNLVEAGIVTLTRQASQTRYQANTQSPVFQELHDFLQKTAGIPQQLKHALKGLGDKIRLAFIYGSYASGEMRPESDIDLMVIGKISFQELVEALHEVQIKLDREINPTVYTETSFRERLDAGFIQGVLDAPKVFLIGGEDELAEVAR